MVKTIRLGKKFEGNDKMQKKPRAIMVTLNTVGQKWGIIKDSKKLKDSVHFKNILIVPDLTFKEREHNRQLRNKLKRLRELGERGWFISKGQLKRRQEYF